MGTRKTTSRGNGPDLAEDDIIMLMAFQNSVEWGYRADPDRPIFLTGCGRLRIRNCATGCSLNK
jgi:hypothetical protein